MNEADATRDAPVASEADATPGGRSPSAEDSPPADAEPAGRSRSFVPDLPPIGLIWAEARGGVIGARGGLPWHVPEDLAHFRAVTMGDPVVMGRRTWESLPERFRPLPGRANIVVTRHASWQADGAERAGSVEEALGLAGSDALERIWVIGGAELFAETIGFADRLEVTELDLDVEGDTFAPDRGDGWRVSAADPADGWRTSRTGIRYRFTSLTR